MKKGLTIGLVGVALAATLSFVAASSLKREPVTAADALPVYEVLTTVRSMGLNPAGDPVRQGPHYVLHAYDRRGIELRVIADAHFGDILSIAPARALTAANAPNVQLPRIIHVPQPGERDGRVNVRPDTRASVNRRVEPAVIDEDDDDGEVDAAPPPSTRRAPPPSRTVPRRPLQSEVTPLPPQRRPDAPPPPGPRRAILSAPPPAAEGPSPIRPTPRFNAKPDAVTKFGPPREPEITLDTPPAGYTPPSGMPGTD